MYSLTGHRLRKLDVTVGNSLSKMEPCGHFEGPATDGELVIKVCKQPIKGRYVKLQIMDENARDNYLHVAEVEVYE